MVDHGYYREPADVVARALRLLVIETFLNGNMQYAATVEEALAILDKAPKILPMPGDELPEGWNFPRQE